MSACPEASPRMRRLAASAGPSSAAGRRAATVLGLLGLVVVVAGLLANRRRAATASEPALAQPPRHMPSALPTAPPAALPASTCPPPPSRGPRRRGTVLAVIGLVLVAASLPAAARGLSASTHESDVVTVDGVPGDMELPDKAPAGGPRPSAPRPAPVSSPVRLTIPAIEVDTALMGLGLRADGGLQTPPRFEQPGWYQDGPAPGSPGAALIVGHVDSHTGPAVFYRLERLRPGDVITVGRTDGTTVRFAVRSLESYPKDAFPTARVFGGVRTPELRLITCFGSFDKDQKSYTRNLVVFAALLPTPQLPKAPSLLRVTPPQEDRP